MATEAALAFPVSPPPGHATLFLVLMAALLPAGILAALWASGAPPGGAGPALVVIPVVFAALLLAMRARSVSLRDGMLEVRAAVFRRRVAVGEFDLERARIVDLAERTELRPVLKTGGISIPGFHAGRFRLRQQFGKAFCLLTDRHRVLWLPLRDGKDQLLLSVEQPQRLLDALRGATR